MAATPSGRTQYADPSEEALRKVQLEKRVKWQQRQRSRNSSVDLTIPGSPLSTFTALGAGHKAADPSSLPGTLSPRPSFLPRLRRAKRWLLIALMCLSASWLLRASYRSHHSQSNAEPLFAPFPKAPGASQAVQDGASLPPLQIEPEQDEPIPAFSRSPATNPLPFIYPPKRDRRHVESIHGYEPLTSQVSVLDDWIARGRVSGQSSRWTDHHEGPKHDLLVAWVNGSDWEHTRALQHFSQDDIGSVSEWWDQRTTAKRSNSRRSDDIFAARNSELKDVGENRFREMGELKYVIRSGRQHLQDLRATHIVSPSFYPPSPFDYPTIGASESAARSLAPVAWSAPRRKHSVIPTEDGRRQWGQIPAWLNVTQPGVMTGLDGIFAPSENDTLRVHHDWTIFTPNWLFNDTAAAESGNGYTVATLALWKQEVLPTFNSIAVESMLGHENMPGLAETFVYNNDDMFFTSQLTGSDFSSPLFGPVLRLNPNLLVRGHRQLDGPPNGEWPSLKHSAWLLDQRFGSRPRAYTAHEPRSFNTRLLREMRSMWASEWRDSAELRFRYSDPERPGASTSFLFAHFLIERHREALLWSYLVLKLDQNGDGEIDTKEMAALLQPLGVFTPSSFSEFNPLDPSNTASVKMPYRSLQEHDGHLQLLDALDLPRPLKTEYTFISSEGGYPFMTLHPFVQDRAPARPEGAGRESGISQVGHELFPRFHPRQGKSRTTDRRFTDGGRMACQINFSSCLTGFTGERVPAERLFKRFAFEEGEHCGDCLLVHLLHASNERGFEALLPKAEQMFAGNASEKDNREEPHLPLTSVFQYPHQGVTYPPLDIDLPNFSQGAVSSTLGWAGASQREFALRLIQRYSFVIGSTPSLFYRIEHEASTSRFLRDLTSQLQYPASANKDDHSTVPPEMPSTAFVCLNDDYGSVIKPQIRRLFEQWANRAFPLPMPWEDRIE